MLKKIEIKIPKNIGIHEDSRTKAKTMAVPIQFDIANSGILMLCKITNKKWIPSDEIESITINFKK